MPMLLTAYDLHKHYRMGDQDLHVLRGVGVTIEKGEWVAILGASGCGKSTLLHLLGGLDRPDVGSVKFENQNVFSLRGGRLDRYRSTHVGFVFQFYHLLPELNALENVLIGEMVSRRLFGRVNPRVNPHQRAHDLLTKLGLADRLHHRPNKLSGGERQRVAIARALINEPAVLLADEPTGNLDAETGGQILDVLKGFHEAGQTIVMVTHDTRVAQCADRQLTLEKGRLKA